MYSSYFSSYTEQTVLGHYLVQFWRIQTRFFLDSDHFNFNIFMYFTAMKMENLCILFAVIVIELVDVVSAADEQISVSVNVGDSLTLHTGYIRKPEDMLRWYFKDNRISQIIGNVMKICTDEHCVERFRDRLQLNNQTGDLTITNITTEHTGNYLLDVISSDIRVKIFNLTVQAGVSGTDVIKKMKEGESVSLDSGVTEKLNDWITWYFNGIRIAQINGNPSEACTDVQCDTGNERLRERLKLNHQTGSLTIINTRITDTGEYQREITSSSSSISRRRRSISFSSRKTFSVTVIKTEMSPGAIAGICVGVLLLAAAAVVINYKRRNRRENPEKNNQVTTHEKMTGVNSSN